MPRRPRTYLPGFTYHIVQRGNNREACFFDEENYLLFLQLIYEIMPRYGVQLHSYCLMTNHIHLLITPSTSTGISSLMQVVCSRYAFFMNKTYNRSGTVWEGRHKASAVESERYLLQCYRYIELNPVAASMASRPEEYRWSSYHTNAWGEESELITPHAEYLNLGQNITDRCYNYRELFQECLSEQQLHSFKKAAHYCMPVGSDRFLQQIQLKAGRPLGYMKRGRPTKGSG